MKRDRVAERRVKFAAWILWKLEAVVTYLYGLVLIAGLLFVFISKRGLERMGPAELVALAIAVPLIFLIGWFYWWLGESLEKLKNWAWWLATFKIGLPLALLPLLLLGSYYQNRSQIPSQMSHTEFVLLHVALGLIFAIILGALAWPLWSKRGRRLFTDKYRRRLQEGTFSNWKEE